MYLRLCMVAPWSCWSFKLLELSRFSSVAKSCQYASPAYFSTWQDSYSGTWVNQLQHNKQREIIYFQTIINVILWSPSDPLFRLHSKQCFSFTLGGMSWQGESSIHSSNINISSLISDSIIITPLNIWSQVRNLPPHPALPPPQTHLSSEEGRRHHWLAWSLCHSSGWWGRWWWWWSWEQQQ